MVFNLSIFVFYEYDSVRERQQNNLPTPNSSAVDNDVSFQIDEGSFVVSARAIWLWQNHHAQNDQPSG